MIKKCNNVINDKNIVVKENGREFRIKNSSNIEINRVKVDGCFIKSGNRCDYLFEVLSKSRVLYIELKGKDIQHALEQIDATIKHCKDIHKNFIKECYIVASRVPKETTKTQMLKRKFKSSLGTIPNISTNKKEIIIRG